MNVIEIGSLDHTGAAMFSRLTEAQLRRADEAGRGVFIAESPKVIRTALGAGCEPLALLCERRHIAGDAADIIARCPNIPIYTGDRAVLAELTGYTLTRGVLCAMRRPTERTLAEAVADAARVVVMQGVCDTTNVGAIFRSAAALGIGAVVLARDVCDPLNRRVVRVSMGSVFLVPWAWAADPIAELQELGFRCAALALTDRSVPIDHPKLVAEERLALVLGTEGDGLPARTLSEADYVARIPMHHGVDSLNVAAAAAVAMWELRKR
ncbi:MAG: RNA methyltransferase [Bacteroidaceae bacterium]|nr:RNA methyltransferase [Bacteroidaceae bacterium]